MSKTLRTRKNGTRVYEINVIKITLISEFPRPLCADGVKSRLHKGGGLGFCWDFKPQKD